MSTARGISIDWKWMDYQARVRDELETGEVTLPTSANVLINELEVYEYDMTDSGWSATRRRWVQRRLRGRARLRRGRGRWWWRDGASAERQGAGQG